MVPGNEPGFKSRKWLAACLRRTRLPASEKILAASFCLLLLSGERSGSNIASSTRSKASVFQSGSHHVTLVGMGYFGQSISLDWFLSFLAMLATQASRISEILLTLGKKIRPAATHEFRAALVRPFL